jgi:hypothetical protein
MLRLNQPVVVIAMAVLCGASSCVGQSSRPHAAVEQPQPGLLTIMFESTQFKRPTGLSVMEQVNVDTGWNINDYSRLWIGRIKAPVSGTIEVFAEADDGLRLEIGGQRIIDGWGKDQPRSGTFAAQKDQLLPLRLEYYQDGGTGFIRLYWSWPGQPRQLIPASAFFHTPEDRQQIEKIMATAGPIVPAPIPPAPADTPDKSRVYIPGQRDAITWPGDPVPARPGPHLFIDDYLIASAQNLTRQVCQPRRDPNIPNPILTSREDGTFQPYMSVSRSPETGRFRIWYGISTPDKNESASDLAYMESDDGIHWIRPHRVLPKPGPLQFGSEVLDRGPYWPQPDQRYVYSFWYGGLRLWVSPDGWNFRQLADAPLVRHNHDINSMAWDSLRRRYVATMSTFTALPGRFKGARRTTLQSYSTNLLDWTPPVFVLVADQSLDPGETQFYAMEAFLNRGPLRIAMVKILRDDLFSDPPEVLKARGGDFGIGYTTLAWTRDGEHWVRDRDVFFDRGPEGSWDRSHAWIDEQVIVADQVYLYYGGYRSGHKANRFTDRQIGLVTMPLDRYVARQAGDQPATLLTVPLKLNENCRHLLVNADAAGGELRACIRDAKTHAVIPGLSFDDCQPLTADGLRVPILFGDVHSTQRKLQALRGQVVQIEFSLRNARLFAFEWADWFPDSAAP